MPKWVRLWGKKRGTRMSGWWVVGSVSEAAFFGALFLLGVASLTTVVTWQVFWPESTILPVGFGFWLMVIASTSFIVIGLSAFILQISQTLASPEMRSVIVDKAKRDHKRRADGNGDESGDVANLPSLQPLTDSPGVKLAYRLAGQRGESTPLVLSALFFVAWNSMVAVLIVISLLNHFSGQHDWFLTVLLVPFGAVSYFSIRWFFRLFRRLGGIGPTAVEICELPLLPGGEYQVYLCQYGKAEFSRLKLSLVAFEESTYQQGTDVRTERVEVSRITSDLVDDNGPPYVVDPEKPLELDCKFCLPDDIMHSFQGQHNAVTWKIYVEGSAKKWPSFCRTFPVVVYPRDAA